MRDFSNSCGKWRADKMSATNKTTARPAQQGTDWAEMAMWAVVTPMCVMILASVLSLLLS